MVDCALFQVQHFFFANLKYHLTNLDKQHKSGKPDPDLKLLKANTGPDFDVIRQAIVNWQSNTEVQFVLQLIHCKIIELSNHL